MVQEIIAYSTIAIAVAAIGTLLLTWQRLSNQISILKEQIEISKKQNEYLAILEIMKIFSNEVNAKQRFEIYTANKNNSLYTEDGEFQNRDLIFYVASVRGKFDQMGELVKEGYVLKDQFLDMYGGSVIRMYKVLRRHIETERKNRNSQQFAVYFEWIFNEARNYWKAKFRNFPEPEPF